MIVIFTDFGVSGPYMGQMEAVLYQKSPGTPVIRLFADAPGFNVRASAYLLAAYADEFPANTVFLCVVDPGVGTARRPVMMQADGRWYVGPDNGLLEIIRRRAGEARIHEIIWQPGDMSVSFHGRDLFAPVAAMLASGKMPDSRPVDSDDRFADWPDDLAEIVYIDTYGNAMTGLRAGMLAHDAGVEVTGHTLTWSRTFSDVKCGACFWYENANGLIEIAANQASAARLLGLTIGTEVNVSQTP